MGGGDVDIYFLIFLNYRRIIKNQLNELSK